MTKIKNNATQQLNKFVVEHFEATETNSSANTINQFAELVLGWFNETLTENESIVFETIENQIFTMAKYNRGGLKDASGFLKQEINRTFENNVKSAVQLAHIWYSKENKDISRNTKQSKYFYIANNKMMVKSNFSNASKAIKEKNEIVRLPLSEINDFYNNVFEIKKGKTERKNFLSMLESLNTTLFKSLISSNYTVDNETNNFDMEYKKLAEKFQDQSEASIEVSKNLIQLTSFFTDLLNYIDDEKNIASNGDVVISKELDQQIKLFVSNQIKINNAIDIKESYKVKQVLVEFNPKEAVKKSA